MDLEAVIWDFDRVIVDSFPDQYKWFTHICNFLNKPFPYKTIDEFKSIYREPVHPDLYNFLEFNWDDKEEKDIIWKEYRAHKTSAVIDLFEDIKPVIKETDKNYKQAIASSNTTHDAINKQLNNHNLEKYFSVIVGQEDLVVENSEPLLKPHPKCILLALNKLNCHPKKAVYISDQPSDIIAARRVCEYKICPVNIIAVTYGYSTRKKLLEHIQPKYLASSPKTLLKKLK